MLRALLLGLLISSHAGFAADAIPFRLDYQGGNLAMAAGQVNDLYGGVQAWYGGAHVHGDRMQWVQSVVPDSGSDRLWIEHLELLGGPAGPADGHVLITNDTDQSAIDLGFRGVLRPTQLVIDRQAIDPAFPTQVRWTVTLDQPHWFTMSLLLDDNWVPHGGWAEHMVIDVDAELNGEPRCRSIHLYGRPKAEGVEVQKCRLDRLRAPIADPVDLAKQSPAAAEFAIESMAISIHFDDKGAFSGLTPTGSTTMYGSPPQGLRMKSRSGLDPQGIK